MRCECEITGEFLRVLDILDRLEADLKRLTPDHPRYEVVRQNIVWNRHRRDVFRWVLGKCGK